MAHYIFNLDGGEELRERAGASLRAGRWSVDADERHAGALAAGDLALVYLGAPERIFVGRAELASSVHAWTPSDPGDAPSGVLLARVEHWDPPVPMSTVLSRIDTAGGARADFDAGIVRITAGEYETAVAAAATSAPTIELLSWLAERTRTYDEAIDAWRSHCPRLTVWEDALIAGLLRVERTEDGTSTVVLTEHGRAVLARQ